MENKDRNNVKMTVRFNEDTYKTLAQMSIQTDTPMAEFVRTAVQEYIKSENFRILTDYIFRKVKLEDSLEQAFFDRIAEMSYNDELENIFMTDKKCSEIVSEILLELKKKQK